MSEPLAPYRVTARNTSPQSENTIHDDAVARRYGFSGGLVPGVTVYAYLVHPLVEALGAPWLQRGTAEVRFVKPIVDGDAVTMTGAVTERTASGLTATLAAGSGAEAAARVTATLPAGSPTPVNVARYTAAPLPAERPEASRQHLTALTALGAPVTVYDELCATTYLDGIAETLPIFRSADGWVHPAFFLSQANRALDRNVRLGPWVHVASRVRHLGGARVGDRLETRGTVRSLWEKKGREYVELDLLVLAGQPPRPAAHVLHTAIFRLPPP